MSDAVPSAGSGGDEEPPPLVTGRMVGFLLVFGVDLLVVVAALWDVGALAAGVAVGTAAAVAADVGACQPVAADVGASVTTGRTRRRSPTTRSRSRGAVPRPASSDEAPLERCLARLLSVDDRARRRPAEPRAREENWSEPVDSTDAAESVEPHDSPERERSG